MKTNIITVDGKQYVSQPETKLCNGCVADKDATLCIAMPPCYKVIFVKYTKETQ